MKIIYVDEAGINKTEPVTIVLAIVVDADTQWRRAETLVNESISKFVPDEHKNNYIAHATDLHGGGKFRQTWPRESRLALLREINSIPFRIGIPICYGAVKRGALGEKSYSILKESWALKHDHEVDHVFAMYHCLGYADRLLRDGSSANEVATVAVENVPHIAGAIKKTINHLRTHRIIEPNALAHQPGSPKNVEVYSERIVDAIHLMEKNEAPLLQIADACAFTLRRWASQHSGCHELMLSMTGSEPYHEGFERPFVMGYLHLPEEMRDIFQIIHNANISDILNGGPGDFIFRRVTWPTQGT